jgi:NAD(P)-dependent dehydrogenase (short-subunit alcohol dehydrogenase family)
MSKAALNGFTIALSKTLADTSIKVNSVCPGVSRRISGDPRTERRHR